MKGQEIDELECYLRDGGFIKKSCWLGKMHMRYNLATDKFNLLDSVSTPGGERILGVRESYSSIADVPYAGEWVKCTEGGIPLE